MGEIEDEFTRMEALFNQLSSNPSVETAIVEPVEPIIPESTELVVGEVYSLNTGILSLLNTYGPITSYNNYISNVLEDKDLLLFGMFSPLLVDTEGFLNYRYLSNLRPVNLGVANSFRVLANYHDRYKILIFLEDTFTYESKRYYDFVILDIPKMYIDKTNTSKTTFRFPANGYDVYENGEINSNILNFLNNRFKASYAKYEQVLEDRAIKALKEKEQRDNIEAIRTSIIADIEEAVERVYPNLWSWAERPSILNNYVADKVLIIKWPEVNISDGYSPKTHLIRDLYLALPFTLDDSRGYILTANIESARGKVSFLEYTNSYRHSHTRSGKYGFNYCCLGSGPVTELIGELLLKWDISKFELFLHLLNTYVSWESKDGVPYQYYSKLALSSSRNFNYPNNTELNRIYNNYINSATTIPIVLDANNIIPKYTIEENKQFIKELVAVTPNEFKRIIINGSENAYGASIYTKQEIENANITLTREDIGFKFKGETIYYRVIDDTDELVSESIDESNVKPCRGIVHYIKDKIVEEANNYLNKQII